MGLDRLIATLGVTIVALVVATVTYGVAGVVLGGLVVWGLVPRVELVPEQSIGWPLFLPAWPVVVLFVAALLVVAVQAPLVIVSRSRKRRLTRRLAAEAVEWLRGGPARAAEQTGVALLRPSGFRAHARGPCTVELTWNPPAGEVAEVVVYRSTTVFATSPDPGDSQVAVCAGDEAAYADTGLDDDRVFHYTAFARDRSGRWSPPAWAWVATPAAPLHTKLLGSLRTFRIPVPGSVR